MVMSSPIWFFFCFPSLPVLLFHLFFVIPAEWNPLRRGGGCNRLTICYYSTCSSLLPCTFFSNAIAYSVSLFPFRIVAGLGCSFQPLASRPAAFLVSPSLLNRINCSRSFTSHRSCSSTHSSKRANRQLSYSGFGSKSFVASVAPVGRTPLVSVARRRPPSPLPAPLRSSCRIRNRLPLAHRRCKQPPRHRHLLRST